MKTVSITQYLQTFIWNLHRFGLTPAKILKRFGFKTGPSILTVSIPKSGTHLLERALCLYPLLYRKLLPTINPDNINKFGGLPQLLDSLKPGQILVSHLLYSDLNAELVRTSDVRCIFMIRDPRDIAISESFYALKNKRHVWHRLYASLPDSMSRIRVAIEGDASVNYPSILTRINYFTGWLYANVHVVKFEDLIGSAGGGSQSKHIETLTAVFDHIGLTLNDHEVVALSSNLFSSVSPTFRQGKIGQWQTYFDNELNAIFSAVAGDLLGKYGYTW
jgi:hypothetical protein